MCWAWVERKGHCAFRYVVMARKEYRECRNCGRQIPLGTSWRTIHGIDCPALRLNA